MAFSHWPFGIARSTTSTMSPTLNPGFSCSHPALPEELVVHLAQILLQDALLASILIYNPILLRSQGGVPDFLLTKVYD